MPRLDLDVSLALVALGMADADEAALVDDAIAHVPALARVLGGLSDAAACLPLALPRARPPPLG